MLEVHIQEGCHCLSCRLGRMLVTACEHEREADIRTLVDAIETVKIERDMSQSSYIDYLERLLQQASEQGAAVAINHIEARALRH